MRVTVVNIEASAEDISANKRLGDILLGAISGIVNEFSGIRYSGSSAECEQEEEGENEQES